MKRTLCLLLSALLLLSSAVITASAAPADVTATVNGVALAKGGQVSAVSSVVFELPDAVADLTAVKFYEQSKTLSGGVYPWFERAQNYAPVLSNGNKTVTVTFERGDISSNSTYKFEFDTNAATDGAEYTFNFTTTAEVEASGATVYFAENFSRYKGALSFATNSSGTNRPNNLDPLSMDSSGGYCGSSGNYVYVTTSTAGDETFPILSVYAAANYVNNVGVNVNYSAKASSLQNVGELTVEFQAPSFNTASVSTYFDFGGVVVEMTPSNPLVWKVLKETTLTARNTRTAFNVAGHAELGTITFNNLDTAKDWHTIKIISDVTTSASATLTSRKLIRVILDDTVVWEQSDEEVILPAISNNVQHAGAPWGSTSHTSEVAKDVLFAPQGSGMRVRYAEYKDYIPTVKLSGYDNQNTSTPIENGNLVSLNPSFDFRFDMLPTFTGSDATAAIAGQITLKDANDTPVALSYTADDLDDDLTLTVTPIALLAPNTTYTISIPGQTYAGDKTGPGASYTFTTGWEQLEVSSATSAFTPVVNGNSAEITVAPTAVSVENLVGTAISYKTVLALYREDNGIVNLLDYNVQNHTWSADGDITVDALNFTDDATTQSAKYFAKLFFISGEATDELLEGEALAEPIILNAANVPAYTKPADLDYPAGSQSDLATKLDVNRGRVDVAGYSSDIKPERAVWAAVAKADRTVLYLDQLTSDVDRQFAFGGNIVPDVSITSCDITVKPSAAPLITEAGVAMDFSTLKPYVTTMTITGNPVIGGTLTAAYEIADFLGRAEQSKKYAWYVSTSTANWGEAVATTESLDVTSEMLGSYIKCVVTPIAETDIEGDPYDSSIQDVYVNGNLSTGGAELLVQLSAMVGGTPVYSGNTVCAVSTLTFNLPAAVADLSAVTFYEKSKTPTTSGGTDFPWYKRNFDGVLTEEGKTFTVTFERGDISSNSTYKFEFDTDTEALGAEYSFDFVTSPEVDSEGRKVYFAENFSRYQWESNADRNFIYAGWAVNPLPYNLDPIRKMRTWIGSGTDFYSGTDVDTSGVPYMSVYASGEKYAQFGINPSYSAPINSLNHLGEFTVNFKAANVNQIIDFAGLAIAQTLNDETGAVTWTFYGENTAKRPTTDNTFDAAAHTRLCEKTFASQLDATGKKHTLSIATDTSLTLTGAATRKLLKLTLDGETIWEASTDHTFTFPVTGTGDDSKGVPWASSQTSSVSKITNLFNSAKGTLMVYSAEYKDFKPEVSIVVENDPRVNISAPITINLKSAPAYDTAALKQKITLKKEGGSTVTWSCSTNDEQDGILVMQHAALERNKKYTVTVPALTYPNGMVSEPQTLTFTTDWATLNATPKAGTEIAVNNGTVTLDLSASDAVTVTNMRTVTVNFKAVLALYRVENQTIHQVKSVVTDGLSVTSGQTKTISAGSINYTETGSGSYQYYAKLFLISTAGTETGVGAAALADAIVFNPDNVVTTSTDNVTTGNAAYVSATTDKNSGHVGITGQSVGSLEDRALWITVSEADGTVAYYEQLSTGDTENAGKFAFDFSIDPQGVAADKTYTVTVDPSDKASFTTTAILEFSAVNPFVVDITSISDTVYYKGAVTVTYVYSDLFDRAESGSVIEWYTASEPTGTYTRVATTNQGEAYTIPASEAGKYLKVVIKAKTADSDFGTPYDSVINDGMDPIYIKSQPEIKTAQLVQNGNIISLNGMTSDPLNHEHDVPTVKWIFKNAGGTVVKTIEGNPVQTSYTATAADAGLTVYMEYTPRIKAGACALGEACTDILAGDMVTTNTLTITYESSSVGTTTGPNGGGGGGGTNGSPVKGSQNPIEKESAPVYQSPDEQMDTGRVDLEDARGHWAEKEIFELYDKGVVKGKTANTFDPDGQITRAEFMAILVRAMGLETTAFAGDFNDVAAGSWYADILATAKSNGLLAGSNGNANPDQAITREEMVQIIVRAYEMKCGEIKVGGGFLDYTDAGAISDWAQLAVIKASEISLVNGTGDGRFSPLANTTRAQSAVLIVRLLPHLEKAAEEAAKAAEEAAKAQEEAAQAEAEAALPEEVEEVAAEPEAAVSEETTGVGAEDAPAAE